MEKCIQVNVLSPTRVKERELVETYRIYYSMVQTLGRSLKDHERIARRELHRRTYSEMREAFQVPSQLAISARVHAWNLRKHRIDRLKRISVRFDRRPFRLAETGRGNPVLSVRVRKRRIGIPIKRDGAYKRLKEHLEDGWEASQTRPRRGHVGKENWKGYSYFQCVKCGYECDRDRNASRNTALGGATALGRAALGRPLKARLPRAGMHVMASVRSHEGASSQRHIA